MSGYFITFEGTDGSGKTSIIKKLQEKLSVHGYAITTTREPGGSPISEQIRTVILAVDNKAMDGVTEALLYAASRRQHVQEVIAPALAAGKLILCDRYLDSSLAYQGYARGVGIDKVYALNALAIGEYLPDLTILIDIPVAVGLARIEANNRPQDRLDLESRNFHEAVRAGYLAVQEKYPDRIVLVDGVGTLAEVVERVYQVIIRRLEQRDV